MNVTYCSVSSCCSGDWRMELPESLTSFHCWFILRSYNWQAALITHLQYVGFSHRVLHSTTTKHHDASIIWSHCQLTNSEETGHYYLNLPVLRSDASSGLRYHKIKNTSSIIRQWSDVSADQMSDTLQVTLTDWLTEAHCTLFNSQAAPGSLYWL